MMDWGERGQHMTTGGWIFMAMGMLILIVLAVVLVMWIVSQPRKTGADPVAPGMSAREVLDHRLASGEITTDQYDQLRTRLDPHAGPSAAPAAGPG
jgi:uncharacterized membrane protein